LRSMGELCSHQQAAITAAFDGEPRSIGVTGLNEVFGASGEIVKYVLLPSEHAREVPIVTVLGAAAQIGLRENATLVKPNADVDVVHRADADPKTAIPGEESGILSVELRATSPNDVDRDSGTVFRGGELAHDFGVAEVGRRLRGEMGALGFVGSRIKAEPCGGSEIRLAPVDDIVGSERGETVDSGNRGNGYSGLFVALQVENADIGRAAPNTQNVKAMGCGQDVFNNVIRSRHNGGSIREGRMSKRQAENGAAR